MIYVILAPEIDRAKIGVSDDPKARLRVLRTGSPIPLRLHAVIEGGAEEESRLHYQFQSFRLHGEWFEVRGELKAWIDLLPPLVADISSPKLTRSVSVPSNRAVDWAESPWMGHVAHSDMPDDDVEWLVREHERMERDMAGRGIALAVAA